MLWTIRGRIAGGGLLAASPVEWALAAESAGGDHAQVAAGAAAAAAEAFLLGPPAAASPGVGAAPDPERVPEPQAQAEAARPAVTTPREPSAQAPFRWHAEWTEEGLRLWLGVDSTGTVLAPGMVGVLVAEARRFADARGSRLVSFVCNGRTVFEEGMTEVGPSGQAPEAGPGRVSSSSQALLRSSPISHRQEEP